MRLNARIFFSPLAPPHSLLRRLVETCGVLGCVAAPAPSDVFASVRSVLGDVVTRCSSILGASSITIFQNCSNIGCKWAHRATISQYVISTECFACCFLAISCRFYMYAVLRIRALAVSVWTWCLTATRICGSSVASAGLRVGAGRDCGVTPLAGPAK